MVKSDVRLHSHGWRAFGVMASSLVLLGSIGVLDNAAASTPIFVASPSASGAPSQGSPQSNPPTLAGLEWKPTSQRVNGEAPVQLATVDRGNVALMWMNPNLLTFRFVPGSRYPEGSPSRAADHQPSTWLSHLAAAFNGGFKLSDHEGGYAYYGKVVSPLKPGLATLTVDLSGHLNVEIWGPTSSTHLAAIRQNLPPLIAHGQVLARPSDGPNAWGRSLHLLNETARSALGQLADGSLVFATGAHASAYQIGEELKAVGAQTAIMLDMNRTWPTGYVYDPALPGKKPVGHKILPSTYSPPSKYYVRDKKDFIVAQLKAS